MAQYFKGDDTEIKMEACASPIIDATSIAKDEFLAAAYECQPLGELLYDNALAPLSNAIKRDIFITSFKQIFDAFLVAGTFESYLTVFKKIFGNDVIVTFTVPEAGKLNIDIDAQDFILYNMVERLIVDNAYVLSEIITQDGDNLAIQNLQGFETQYEIEQMLFELVPAGIYTQITLSIGV